MDKKILHLIAFDNPEPPTYGGVIDVFYKIKALSKTGIEIILHIWEYNGSKKAQKLQDYCKEVHYYPRQMSWTSHLSYNPFIVQSRHSKSLEKRLLEDNHPILLEGLHSCGILNNKKLLNRRLIFRAHNIEHHYYFHLAKNEKSTSKKIFFLLESLKLLFFEQKLELVDTILSVSREDEKYFRKKYSENNTIYLPSFQANDQVISKIGRGNFILFHGNLEVSENDKAALFLVRNIFSEIDFQVIIAGRNPTKELQNETNRHSNIRLIANPSMKEMKQLTTEAQIHLLYTFQATGLKLKLLNSIFQGRHILVNEKMIRGTGLDEAVDIAIENNDIITSIQRLMQEDFTEIEIQKRMEILQEHYSNEKNALKIQELL